MTPRGVLLLALAAVVLGGLTLAIWHALNNFRTPGAERTFARAISTACGASLLFIAVGLA